MSRGFQFIVTNIGLVPICFSLTSGDPSFDQPPNVVDVTLEAGASWPMTYCEISGSSNNAVAQLSYFSPSTASQTGNATVIFDDNNSVNFSNGSVYFSALPTWAPIGQTDQANTCLFPYIVQSNTGQWTLATFNVAIIENIGMPPNPS